MSILSELQNKRLSLIELIAMGYVLLFKHSQTYFFAFCAIFFPVLIPLCILNSMDLANLSGLTLFFLGIAYFFTLIFVSWTYYTAIAVITEKLVDQKSNNY